MQLRLWLVAALALGVGCGPTVLRCDDACTPSSSAAICPASTLCLESAIANVNRCLPAACATCPIGKCTFDVACGTVSCSP